MKGGSAAAATIAAAAVAADDGGEQIGTIDVCRPFPPRPPSRPPLAGG